MIINTLKEAPAPFTNTEIYTLSNGLRIILKADATVPVVSIQAWARCGAVDESPKINGISHGLEHMVFKGTPRRSAGEISRAIESQGGLINAATQLETTHYYVEVPSYGAEAALDILIDTITNPTFPQDELERERLVILEEIHRRDDSPDATLWDEFISIVFKNTPYEIKVIGSKETVSALTRDDLNNYFKTFYVPSNLNIVVVGDFDRDAVLRKLKMELENRTGPKAPDQPVVKLDQMSPLKHTVKKPLHLSYIALGLPTVGLEGKEVIALDLLSDVLGGGTSSRLVQHMREDKQVVFSLSCDYIPFKQKGLFCFFLEAAPEKTQLAIDTLYKELERVKIEGIRPDELSRSKARTKSDWLLGSETPRGQASTLGSLSILGHIDLISSYLPRIDSLTVNEINDVFQKTLADQKFSCVILEPNK